MVLGLPLDMKGGYLSWCPRGQYPWHTLLTMMGPWAGAELSWAGLTCDNDILMNCCGHINLSATIIMTLIQLFDV